MPIRPHQKVLSEWQKELKLKQEKGQLKKFVEEIDSILKQDAMKSR